MYHSIVPQELDPLSVKIINDIYKSFSAKSGTRLARGEVPRRVYLQGFEQQMVKGKEWNSFFNNIDNTTELINLTVDMFKSEQFRKKLDTTLITTNGDKTWKITRYGAEHIFNCDHDEADMRMVLHTCTEDTLIVVVSRVFPKWCVGPQLPPQHEKQK